MIPCSNRSGDIGLFDKSSGFRIVDPKEALGAYTANLDSRFSNPKASFKDALVRDLKSEDEALKSYVDACRLEKWFESTLDLAKQSIAREANEETETGLAMQQVARELQSIEEQIARRSRDSALNLLASKPRFKPRAHLSSYLGISGGSARVR